ncbi:MAG: nitroreductase family deazaflavin-dependent oxidoreductase [Acidimicrobiia bacterium]|nr:nitroreductase family deazaflavin-dependent oxidoreductase [Acidimicrobiia bacterium]NNL68526.1 nitroreductase family deazaflavin-dependent oxidoreductase [Acidimicrobiia bacterium]
MNNRTKMRLQWRMHKLVWNLSGGRLGRRIGEMPVVELITTGRKSGQERQILITFLEDDGGPILIGTNAGLDRDPAWVHNLRANPTARARWNGTWRTVQGVELAGTERAAAWQAAVDAFAGYADYAAGLTRTVPIVQLRPA